jgi:hypothetical protein
MEGEYEEDPLMIEENENNLKVNECLCDGSDDESRIRLFNTNFASSRHMRYSTKNAEKSS